MPPHRLQTSVLCLMAALLPAGMATVAKAQSAEPQPVVAPASLPQAGAADSPTNTLQGQLGLGSAWSVGTQATYIDQWHYGFPAAYDGPNSLQNTTDTEHTFSYSLFLDRKVWQGGELIYNPEIFQGHGLGQTLGVAGFPNGEAVKSGFANLHYNTSRLFLRQVIGLGGEKEESGARR